MIELNVYRVIAYGRTGYKALNIVQNDAISILTGKAYMTKEHLAALTQLGFDVKKVSPPDID